MRIKSSLLLVAMIAIVGCGNSTDGAVTTTMTNAIITVRGYKIEPNANLVGAVLLQLNLANVDLSGADLTGADLQGSILTGANLANTELRDAILTGANLSGANLTGVLANGAKLTGSNLEGANLTNADLTQVQMSRTNMKNANLTNAKMWSTTVDLAEMDGANLKGADVYNVDFEFARVSLKGAIMPDGSVYGAVTGSTIEQGLASAITDSLVPILQSKGTVDRQCVLDAVSKLSEEELSTVATNEVFLASLSTCVS